MTANEAAILATEAMPYLTAAPGAYGHAVLSKTRDKAADATIEAGADILQRIFGRKKASKSLPEPLADVVAHPSDDAYLTMLKVAVRKLLERDETMLVDVRTILADIAVQPSAVQNVTAGRDAYVAGRDMTISRRPE